MQKRRGFAIALIVWISGALVAPAAAQSITGTILGVVKDSTGAVLPGASVSIVNEDTRVTRAATTNGVGEFQVEFLPVGTYRVEITLDGFKRSSRSGVVMEVNRTARVDAVLEVGTAAETVEVRADSPLVETTRVALGRTVTQQEVLNLPLVDRDLYALLDLTAGVDSSRSTNVFGSPGQETLVNGSANAGAGSVNYNLDGGANASGLRNTGNVVPNPDAVREFRVVTNNYSAEYGRFAGGVVDVVTKSGTNRLKGTLFEFFRNEALNANRWAIGESSLEKDPIERNNFGGSLGGPIARNRTFFFGSYNALRQTTTEFANDARVPTALERAGDFSQSATKPRDPNTGQLFPNGLIPSDRFDSAAVRILKDYIPLPNLPGNLYEVQESVPQTRNEITVKLDHEITKAQRVSGSYFSSRGHQIEKLRGNLPWANREFTWNQQNFNVGHTWTLRGNTVNEGRVTYVRSFGGRLNTPEVGLDDLDSSFRTQGPKSLPQISVSGYFSLTSAIAGPVAGSHLTQLRDTLSLTRGRHSIRVGGEYSFEAITHDTTLNNYGVFTFDGTKTGNAFADFLTGNLRRFTQDAPVRKTDNGWYLGVFAQDDYRVLPRLTLNLGLRYDLQPPLVDPLNRKTTFVPGRVSTVVPAALPGMLFPGDEGVGRGISAVDRNNVAPRIGFAWDVHGNGRTAVRGAFGIFYGTISGNMWNATADGQPFTTRQTFNTPGTLANPYSTLPGGSPFPYEYAPNNPRFVFPANISGPSLDFKMAYTYQTNLAVQRQIASGLSATVAYVGARGHDLPFGSNLNYPLPGTGGIETRRPYLPGQLGTITVIESILSNQYDGLQITVDKRMGRAFQASGSYVLSESLEDAQLQSDQRGGAQNFRDLAAERGRTDNNRTHVAKISAIWQPRLASGHALLRTVANGWTISAIARLASGSPLTITSGRDNNNDGNTNDRADAVPGVDPVLDPNRSRGEVIEQWFNTAAFVENQPLTDGNTRRNILDGPGYKIVDLGMYRNFGLGRGRDVQFRVEATNAFNMVNLSNPTTNVRSSTYGKIRTARQMRQIQLGVRFSF
jgi:outer membrane receptor protein involved in Fe transport